MRFHSKLKRFSGLRQAYAAGRSARLNAQAGVPAIQPPQTPDAKPQTPITITETSNEQQTR